MDKRTFLTWCLAIVLLYGYAIPPALSAIQGIMGIAVDAGGQDYNTVKDATTNQTISDGVVPCSEYVYNGTNHDRASLGNEFYAIKRDNIAAASVNIAFGFPAKTVIVETPITNNDEVCIDWLGGTAVCPAANTAGDDKLTQGRVVLMDNMSISSISFIANSGTQTIFVRAHR